MRRILLILLQIAIVVGIAAWLAEHPGHLSIDWQGWRLDSSVSVLAVVLVAMVLVGVALDRIWRSARRAPTRMRSRRTQRRREIGLDQITQALAAAALGDVAGARRLAEQSHSGLGRTPLALMITADAAEKAGDGAAARAAYEALLAWPETKPVALKGLIELAIRDDRLDDAIKAAREARSLTPRQAWAVEQLFQLLARSGDWTGALGQLDDLERLKNYPKEKIVEWRVALTLGAARGDLAAGRVPENARRIARVLAGAPDFVPAIVASARLEFLAGRGPRAQRLIEQAFAHQPHPDLIAAYESAGGADELAFDRIKRLEKLVAGSPDSAEAHLALGKRAGAAKVWGVARTHLDKAAHLAPSAARRAYEALAEIVMDEHGDADAASDFRARADAAPATPTWQCHHCHALAAHWNPVCESCGSFDRTAWIVPVAPLTGVSPATFEAALEKPSIPRSRWLALLPRL